MPQIRAFFAATSIFLVLSSLCRGLFFWKYRTLFSADGTGEILQAFLMGIRFDLNVNAFLIGLPFLVLNIPGGWKRKKHLTSTLVWIPFFGVLCAAFLSLADLLFYGEAGRHLSSEILLVRGDLGAVAGMATQYPGTLLLLLLLSALLLLGWLWVRRISLSTSWESIPSRRSEVVQLGILFLFLVLSGRGSIGGTPIRTTDAFFNGKVQLGHLALNPLFTIGKALTAADLPLIEVMAEGEAVETVRPFVANGSSLWLDSRFPLLRKADFPPRKAPFPNIVLLVMESWTGPWVGAAGGPPKVTPFFDSLAEKGLFFDNIHAVGARSNEGFVSMLLGIPSFNSSERQNPYLRGTKALNPLRGLGTILGEYGYSSLFIRGAKRDSSGLESLAGVAGVQTVLGKEDLLQRTVEGETFIWGIKDEKMASIMVEEFGKMPQPFLGIWLSLDTHSPYDLAAGSTEFPETFPNRKHLSAMRQTDEALEVFFRLAAREPWYRDTLFVIVADHSGGEGMETVSNLDRHRIPLLLYSPEESIKGRDETLGTQLSLLPTILDLAGIDAPHHAMAPSLLGPREAFSFLNLGQGYGWLEDGCFVTVDPSGKGAVETSIKDKGCGESPVKKHLQAFLQVAATLYRENSFSPMGLAINPVGGVSRR